MTAPKHTVSFEIAGAGFEGRQKTFTGIAVDTPRDDLEVFLERDPKNEYDANAIKVMVKNTKTGVSGQAGWVPAVFAKALAPVMDGRRRPVVTKWRLVKTAWYGKTRWGMKIQVPISEATMRRMRRDLEEARVEEA